MEYLLKRCSFKTIAKTHNRWLSILDINSDNEKTSFRYPIQPYSPKGTFYASLPSKRFEYIVAYYHQVKGIDRGLDRTIYPTGNTALVFRCDYQQPRGFFVGTPTSPIEAQYIIKDCVYFVILFWPGMGYAFSPFPPTELIDKHIPLEEILPGESKELLEKIVLSETYQERVRVFERFMEERLRLLYDIPTGFISLIKTISCNPSGYGSKTLSNCVRYTDRHIRRLFLKYIGVSPKLFMSIARHQKTLRSLNVNPNQNMAGLAYEQGYYDQSHFIKQFKRFQGITPTQFVKNFIINDS